MTTADTAQRFNLFDHASNIFMRVISINRLGVQRSAAFIDYERKHPTPNKFISRMFNSTTLLAIDDDSHRPILRFELTQKINS